MTTASPPTKAEGLRLFISYARADRDPVERLAHALSVAGHRVWWDAALEGGHNFAAEIERELTAADAVIVLWSAASVTSNWVLDEAMHGRDRGCLIPIRLDDTPPPLGYRQIQTIDLEDGAAVADIEAIGRAAARIMGQPISAPTAQLPRMAGRRRPDGKTDYPLWWPFAWAIFGLIIFLILWSLVIQPGR